MLGEIRRRHRRGTPRAGRPGSAASGGSTASNVHTCTPHSTPSESFITRIVPVRDKRLRRARRCTRRRSATARTPRFGSRTRVRSSIGSNAHENGLYSVRTCSSSSARVHPASGVALAPENQRSNTAAPSDGSNEYTRSRSRNTPPGASRSPRSASSAIDFQKSGRWCRRVAGVDRVGRRARRAHRRGSRPRRPARWRARAPRKRRPQRREHRRSRCRPRPPRRHHGAIAVANVPVPAPRSTTTLCGRSHPRRGRPPRRRRDRCAALRSYPAMYAGSRCSGPAWAASSKSHPHGHCPRR